MLYRRKPFNTAALSEETENACAAIVVTEVSRAAICSTNKCPGAHGHHCVHLFCLQRPKVTCIHLDGSVNLVLKYLCKFLFSCCVHVWWTLCSHLLPAFITSPAVCSLSGVIIVFTLLHSTLPAACEIFPLSSIFSSLTVMCIGVDFFLFILFIDYKTS